MPPTRLVSVVPSDAALGLHRATYRTGRVLRSRRGGAGLAARSAGSSRAPGQLGPTSLHLLGPRRSGRFLPGPAAIGRVGASLGALGAAESRYRPSGRSWTRSGASGGRTSRLRWTRKVRLPSNIVDRHIFAAIRIHALIDRCIWDTSFSALPIRRAFPAFLVVAACITGPTTKEKGPRAVAAAGAMTGIRWI
jgi:hypothetical protein